MDAASCIYNFFFGAERDYYRDQDLHQADQAGVKEFDQEKRTAYFREVVDRANRINLHPPHLVLARGLRHEQRRKDCL